MTTEKRVQEMVAELLREWEEQQRKEWYAAAEAEFDECADDERSRWDIQGEYDERQFQKYLERAREKRNDALNEKFAEWISERRADKESELLKRIALESEA